MANQSRGSRRRQVTSNQQRYQVLVFAEGLKTEVIYLNHWHKLYRDKMVLKIAEHVGSAPMSIVREAARVKKSHLADEKKKKGSAYNEYWCVLDVDEHPDLTAALKCASDNGINVALSSPCLEVWFLIHFEKVTAFIDRHEAQKKAYDLLGCTKKKFSSNSMNALIPLHEAAKSHAIYLEKRHRADEAAEPWNPSSNIWKLVDTIRTGRPSGDA